MNLSMLRPAVRTRGLRSGARVAGLIAAAVALVPGGPVLATGDAAARCEGSDAKPEKVSSQKARKAVICLINKERAKHGIGRLRHNEKVDQAANKHNKRMVKSGCFAHQCPGESSLTGRLTSSRYLPCGCSWGAGENIVWAKGKRGSARELVDSWMASSGHRANILDRSFDHVGVGVVWRSPSGRFRRAATATAVFGFRN